MSATPTEAGKVGYKNPPVHTRFQPGVSANPGGKPVGARNSLNAKFLKALSEDFDAGGSAAIALCRETDPSAYVRALIALQPKELEITRDPFANMTEEQLDAAILAVRAAIDASHSAREAEVGQQAGELQPLQEAGRVP